MKKGMTMKKAMTAVATAMLMLAWNAEADTLKWGLLFSGGNVTNPYAGNWSGANWTLTAGAGTNGVDAIPDAWDSAVIGPVNSAVTITVDGTYDLTKLTVVPRTSGFAGKQVTLTGAAGLLRIGKDGMVFDNGYLVDLSIPIEIVTNVTFEGLNNGSGGGYFKKPISGNYKITRTATYAGNMVFESYSTFNGYRNLKQTTCVNLNCNSAMSGGGPLGTNTLELVSGALSTYYTTSRTLYNGVNLEGNFTFGQTATHTGGLTFGTNWNAGVKIHSVSAGAVRTVTVVVPLTINQPIGEIGGGTRLGLIKKGASSMTLGGTAANTFGGGIVISNGTVVASKNVACGNGNVTVAEESLTSTAKLTISAGVASAINDEATLALVSKGANAPAVELGAGVVEVVKKLILDGMQQERGKTYGAVGSGAQVENSTYFTGTGKIKVAPPEMTVFVVR